MSIRLYDDELWLKEAYNNKSIHDISTECKVTQSTIRKYLRRFDIKVRSISESMKLKYRNLDYSNKKHEQWNNDEYRLKHKIIAANSKKNKQEISKHLWQDEGYKNRQQTALFAAMTRETHANISKAIKKKWRDKEYKQKQASLSNHKSVMFSKIVTKMWQNEEYRALKTVSNRKQGEIRRLSTEQFISRAESIHQEAFKYDDTKYMSHNTKVCIICSNCNTKFKQLPHNHYKGSLCQYCRTSTGQREMFDYLKLFVKPELNNRTVISPYEIDIYDNDNKIGVEYHGLRWHSYNAPELAKERNRHAIKAMKATKANIILFQFFDFQWELKRDIVKSMLLNKLGRSKKYDARKLEIKSINRDVARKFFDHTHLKGHRTHTIAFGLCDEQELIMAISLTKCKNRYEITRMSTKLNVIVRGGVSKLISHARNKICSKIYTYADLMHSNGHGYLNSNMCLISTTKPGYFYYKGTTRLSRQQCQKRKLHKFLSNFDPHLSESLNMFNHGYRRVWDAGHLKFVLD